MENKKTLTELERCELAKKRGFTYDPITGEIRGAYGYVITRKREFGYIVACIQYNKKLYNIRAHRLAWFLHYGKLPKNVIDHIDGNTSNNKVENLRDVTIQQNHFNRTTAKGYTWAKNRNKFVAYINVDCKVKFLGYFDTKEEAKVAYLEAKKKYHIIDA